MAEFRFLCPQCGQKLLGDTASIGISIACPTCHQTITIPSAPLASPLPPSAGLASGIPASPTPPPLPGLKPLARPAAPSSGVATSQKQARGPLSALAAASLICSVFVPLGFIPGVICGHLARARMRRNIFLEGEKMAAGGLLISYSMLAASLAVMGFALLVHLYYRPVMVERESAESLSALHFRTLDEVIMDENEDDHDVDGQMHSTNPNNGKPFHSATRGGSFSYIMKVLSDRAMTLNCRYWGGEQKGHVFDIAVDNQIIATQNLTALAPGHYVDMEYKIPTALTRGKTQVKVEFQAHPGMTAGGLYACETLKW